MTTTMLTSRNALFWDVDPDDLSRVLRDSDEWVTSRVFNYGTLEDIAEVIAFYGKERTKHALTRVPLKRVGKVMARLFLDVDTTQHAPH
jgi:hypothetical protein